MERTAELLQSNSNVARGIKTFACELERYGLLEKNETTHIGRSVQQESSTIRVHLRKIQTLLSSCDFATKLVRFDAFEWSFLSLLISLKLFKLLDFRNDDLHYANGKALEELASRSTIDSRSMISLSRDANLNTQYMKFSGLIALLYLPASLVAVSPDIPRCRNVQKLRKIGKTLFSTNLIVFSSQSQFHIHKEIWIFAVSSVGLIILTIVLSRIVEQRQKRALAQIL